MSALGSRSRNPSALTMVSSVSGDTQVERDTEAEHDLEAACVRSRGQNVTDSAYGSQVPMPVQDTRYAEDEGVVEKTDPNLVTFDGPDDPENPKNWRTAKKMYVTFYVVLLTLCCSLASSSFSPTFGALSETFGNSLEVSYLTLSLFVLGFAFGPVIFGPLSELYGRNLGLFPAFLLFIIFNIPQGAGQNIQTVIIARFIGGVFASAPFSVCAGSLADLWESGERGYAFAAFTAGTYLGPLIGPIIGGFIVESYLGWRWTVWVILILSGAVLILGLLTLPETFAPRILVLKAKRLRRQTGNNEWYADHERNKPPVSQIVQKVLVRPIKMLCTELILLLLSIYVAFVYSIQYLILEAFPAVYHDKHGWNLGVASLPFLAVAVGVFVGCAVVAGFNPYYERKRAENGGRPVPEARLPPMMIGAVAFPIGLFWFGWSGQYATSWVPSTLAGIPIGISLSIIFMQALSYLGDAFTAHAASAVAANAFLRAILAGAFPLFSSQMYDKLGIAWASSLLGFLALGFMPIPFLFFKFGGAIRKRSKYAGSP
ncbi:hypothetical protein YB2330_004055 [Saitoella coloradoensis]